MTYLLAARKYYSLWRLRTVGLVCLAACLCALTGVSSRAFSNPIPVNPQGATPFTSAPQATAPAPNPQGAPIIEGIRFEGNRRIRNETLMARIFTRAGDPLNQDLLRRDFRALWNTHYFEDIRLEVEDSPDKPGEKIVYFYLTERPVIRRIEYKGNKSVSESDILDRFKMAKVGLTIESEFDPTVITKASVTIKELLAEHGRQFATVKPTYERLPGTGAVSLTFNIDEGPKVKVGTITITGNKAFSSRRIIRSMRHTRPWAIPLGPLGSLPVLAKTYDKEKLDDDLEIGIRELYRDNGYFRAQVEEGDIKTVDENRGGIKGLPLVGPKHGKGTDITINIEEGERYRMGTLHIHSSDPEKGLSLKTDYLEAIFPLKKGDIFDIDKVRKSVENYTKLYGNYGFIDFTAEPDFDIHDDSKTIDLTLAFDEQKQFYVRRIEFSGNVGTRDKVIRRELLINEGDLFRNQLWELSLLRLNQLNYFDEIKPENAELKRNQQAGTVDINLKVKEKGKQSISLTGGVSGLEGSYIGLTYQTNNFLGLGETLTLSGNVGTIQRTIQFGFTEPYLFDRPISTGFTVFSNRFNFDQAREASILAGTPIQLNPNTVQNYTQNSDGFTLFASYPMKHFGFTRLGLTYGFTRTSIQSLSTAATALFDVLQFQSLTGPSALTGIDESRVVPSLTYNTIDNPVNSTHGRSVFYSFAFEGGPLGGNVKSVTNTIELKYFRQNYHKRNVIGVRFLGAFISGYGGEVVPPYSRMYLGGETDLRGFDVRTVSPVVFIPSGVTTPITYSNPTKLDAGGNPTAATISVPTLSYQASFPGGDTSGVFNFEYRIPVAPHVGLTIFNDIGTTGILRRDQLQLNTTDYTSLLQEFPGVKISQQLPIQPGTNFKLRDSAGLELVVNVPILQAPFRIYWAYNALRESQVITAPATLFPGSATNTNDPAWQIYKAQVPLTQVWNAAVMPQLLNIFNNPQRTNFFDPIRTFRFTVSRTF